MEIKNVVKVNEEELNGIMKTLGLTEEILERTEDKELEFSVNKLKESLENFLTIVIQ